MILMVTQIRTNNCLTLKIYCENVMKHSSLFMSFNQKILLNTTTLFLGLFWECDNNVFTSFT